MSSDPMEQEVKFFIKTPASMHQRLHATGARPKPKVFEVNTCYDTAQHHIVRSDGVLRLRQDDTCHLTLKCRPDIDDPDVKVYRELEVLVSNFDTTEKILGSLGYHPVRRYEKWRQTYILNDTLLCMDTLPFGNFLEIEGDKKSIRHTAEQLGLAWQKRILTSYLAIFDQLQKDAHLTCKNPTFDQFKGITFSIEPFLDHFEAGR